jgi:hypothetical protein
VPGMAPLPVIPGGKPGQPIQLPIGQPAGAMVQFTCPNCKKVHNLQADFDKQQPLQPGAERFPANDILICSQCRASHSTLAARRQIELQTKRKVAR